MLGISGIAGNAPYNDVSIMYSEHRHARVLKFLFCTRYYRRYPILYCVQKGIPFILLRDNDTV